MHYIQLYCFIIGNWTPRPLTCPKPSLEAVDSNTVKVHLPRFHNKAVEFRGYEISMQMYGGVPHMPWQTVASLPEKEQTHVMRGLKPSTTYAFRLRARIEPGGFTSYSAPARITTDPIGQFTHHHTTYM